VERGAGAEAPPVPEGGPRRDPGDAPVVALCQALLRHRCAETGLASELIATQSELAQLVGETQRGVEPPLRVLAGWRREVVGDELLALIAGRLALAADPDGRLRVVPAGD
jgi:ribonuclease D